MKHNKSVPAQPVANATHAILSTKPHGPLREDHELDANKFAEEILIPRAELKKFLKTDWKKKSSVINFAESIGIAPGIVVGQLQHKKVLQRDWMNDLKEKVE